MLRRLEVLFTVIAERWLFTPVIDVAIMEGPQTSKGQVRGRNLLLATDGKPHSAKAIDFALEMAKLTASKLFIMSACLPGRNPGRYGSPSRGGVIWEDIYRSVAV